jgi:hypothetical protein
MIELAIVIGNGHFAGVHFAGAISTSVAEMNTIAARRTYPYKFAFFPWRIFHAS